MSISLTKGAFMKKILFALVLCCFTSWISCENTETYLTSSHSQVHRAISKHRKVRYQKGFVTPTTYQEGEFHQELGGVVIYVIDNGQHGLVAAIENAPFTDVSVSPYWSTVNEVTLATYDTKLPPAYTQKPYSQWYAGGKNQDAIGDQNTYPAFSQATTWQDTQYVKKIKKHQDWFLPGFYELTQMRKWKSKIDQYSSYYGISYDDFLGNKIFWSSEQKDANNAYGFNFQDGTKVPVTKQQPYPVRYVRAF